MLRHMQNDRYRTMIDYADCHMVGLSGLVSKEEITLGEFSELAIERLAKVYPTLKVDGPLTAETARRNIAAGLILAAPFRMSRFC